MPTGWTRCRWLAKRAPPAQFRRAIQIVQIAPVAFPQGRRCFISVNDSDQDCRVGMAAARDHGINHPAVGQAGGISQACADACAND
jgi:hypothetical protein